MSIFIFAIETSCDETSASILKDNKVLSNIISSQMFHSEYGGIVPELASRAHIEIIDQIAAEAFRQTTLERKQISLVAATQGPGLIGSLLVGYNYAKSFAISSNIPFIGINHIKSHLFSCFIGRENIDLPFIALVVSGGHTIIFLVESYTKYKVLGQTVDDAAGEAFDKVAKMLGLSYPGGPEIDRLANEGSEDFHSFPVSKIKDNEFDFSFSGIKTSMLYFLKKNYGGSLSKAPLADICASFRKAVVKNLVDNTMKAATKFGVHNIAISGGVSANSKLREEFGKFADQGFNIFFPEKIYSTDNAAMIGYAAYLIQKNSPEMINESSLIEHAFPRFDFQNSM